MAHIPTITRRKAPQRDEQIFRAGFLAGQRALLDKLKTRSSYFMDELSKCSRYATDKLIYDLEREHIEKPDDDYDKIDDIRKHIG